MPGLALADNGNNTVRLGSLGLHKADIKQNVDLREKSRPRKSPLPMEIETGDLDENKRARVDEPVVDFTKLSQSVQAETFKAVLAEDQKMKEEALGSLVSLPDWIDIDKENTVSGNTLEVPQYAREIFRLMREKEKTFLLEQSPLLNHPELSVHMRGVVVDWLVVLQDNYELNHETLYLAVRIMDSFLAHTKKRISKQQFQLVAATAIFVSAKLEERMPPPIDELLYACDNSYTGVELVEMELDICRATEFNFNLPLSYSFLRRFAKCLKLPMDLLTLARYILEVSLMSVEFTTEKESLLAAGALRLALIVSGRREWTRTHEHYTGYNVEQLAPFCRRLHAGLAAALRPRVSTIKDKYSHEVFFKVATRITAEAHEESWYVATN